MSLFLRNQSLRGILSAPTNDGSDLAADILLEASELIEVLTRWYSDRGGHPPEDGALATDEINEVFRPLHTLKGLCQMGGLTSLERLLHTVEDRVAAVREGTESFSQPLFDLLGDLIQVFEQFFQHFPGEMPAELEASILSLSKTAESLTDDPASSSSSRPGQELSTGDTMDLVGLESAESIDSASFSSVAADPSNPDLTPTPKENARFAEFCGRPENLIAAHYKGDDYPDRQSLLASEGYENLTRVAEIIYERTFDPFGTLIVFASDLDAELASSLGAVEAVAIERTDLALAGFEAPWLLVAFDTAALVGDSEVDIEEAAAAAPIATEATSAISSSATGDPKTSQAASLAPEDFDSTNQGQNAAAMELDQEMLADFLLNADELLEQLTQSMLELEGDPGNSEPVEAIFRAAHTIKGTAGMFGFRAIEKLTHVMENTFDRIRKGELRASPALMDGLLAALDRVRACFESLKNGKTAELAINTELNKVLQADYAAMHGIELDPATRSDQRLDSPGSGSTANTVQNSAGPSSSGGVDASGSLSKAAETPKASTGGAKKSAEVGTIRVDLGRLDALVNLVGELVIDRTRFVRIEETLRSSGQNSELLHTMSETLLLFGRHMNDVQSIIMKIRMVPVGNAFYKFTRVVRDLARACGKEIDLVIEGGETELDKTLVEEIGDPLVHLIRNSADHGIEMPADRVAAGKSPRGTITLRAYQDGNMIVISIADDGKGLAVERIKAKAIANGLVSESDLMAEKDVFNLIFEPGFSTAEKVTNISGRGVGMDAVKKSITKLKGVIEIDSIQGSGTQITIKLPLTLAIIPSLLVESHHETYAIPLVNVIESIRIGPEEVQRIGHSEFVKLRERVVPLLRLADTFDLKSLADRMWYSESDPRNRVDQEQDSPAVVGDGTATRVVTSTLSREGIGTGSVSKAKRSKKPRLIFVVVGVGEQRVGLIVEQLMGQQEIVIKSLGSILGRTRGVSGGCVLGNGRVALVLDVGELIEDHSEGGKGGSRAAV